MYRYLSEKGIRTFYSNVSLLDFGESAYKEVIDDALDEVSMMIVVGSKKALEKDPYNLDAKNELEWMTYALDKLQEVFGSPGFWFGETMLVSVASKK